MKDYPLLARLKHYLRKCKYSFFRRQAKLGETAKAKNRRLGEGFFEKYCLGAGLDIGYGGDLMSPNCRGWDFEDGDCQYLRGLNNASFDFVYSSHVLEDMLCPTVALSNWWRVLKPRGYMILYIPHRDLYEKKKELPSRWNYDHKYFFLLDRDEPPDTLGILPLLQRAISDFEIVYAKECRQGHTIDDPEIHSDGEYPLEVVVLKKSKTNAR